MLKQLGIHSRVCPSRHLEIKLLTRMHPRNFGVGRPTSGATLELLVSHPGTADLSLYHSAPAELFRISDSLSLGAEIGGKDNSRSLANVLFSVNSVLHNSNLLCFLFLSLGNNNIITDLYPFVNTFFHFFKNFFILVHILFLCNLHKRICPRMRPSFRICPRMRPSPQLEIKFVN